MTDKAKVLRSLISDPDQRACVAIVLNFILDSAQEINEGRINEALICLRCAVNAYGIVNTKTRIEIREQED